MNIDSKLARAFNKAVTNPENFDTNSNTNSSMNWNFIDGDCYMDVADGGEMPLDNYMEQFDYLADCFEGKITLADRLKHQPAGPGEDELDPGQEEDEKSNLMSFLNLELDSMDNSKIASEIGMLLQYVLPNYGGNGPQSEYGRMLDGVWDALGSDAKGTVDSDADMGFADSRVDTMDIKLSDEDVESLKQAQANLHI